MDIGANIKHLRELIPCNVELVAVSKFHPVEMIQEAYNAGQRYFGESRVQEFLEKEKELPRDIKWHFIGHLQSNKVKSIIGKTFLIESVDSKKLLDLIDKESAKDGIITKVLLQVHVAEEVAKFGFFPDEILSYFKNLEFKSLQSTEICGLMGMATNTDDETRITKDFNTLHSLFEEIKDKYGSFFKDFNKLSMGMSGDWPLAVKCGSNIVRIGSAIFGERAYSMSQNH